MHFGNILIKENQLLEKKLLESNAKIEELTSKLQCIIDVHESFELLKTEHANLKNEYQTMKILNDELKLEMKKKNDEIKSFHQTISYIKKEMEYNLKVITGQLEDKCKEYKSKCKMIKTENISLQQRNQSLKYENEQIIEEYNKLKSLLCDQDELKMNLRKIKSKNLELSQTIEALKEEKDRHKHVDYDEILNSVDVNSGWAYLYERISMNDINNMSTCCFENKICKYMNDFNENIKEDSKSFISVYSMIRYKDIEKKLDEKEKICSMLEEEMREMKILLKQRKKSNETSKRSLKEDIQSVTKINKNQKEKELMRELEKLKNELESKTKIIKDLQMEREVPTNTDKKDVNKPLSWSPSLIHPLLAINKVSPEIQAKIKTLEEEIESLKKENDELKEKISEITKENKPNTSARLVDFSYSNSTSLKFNLPRNLATRVTTIKGVK